MLPTRLGMASLRQTSRLRRNTGHQRIDKRGAAQTEAVETTVWVSSNGPACRHSAGRVLVLATGAGAVVTKNVNAYALVTGNPATQTGWMSEAGHKLVFNSTGIAICLESNQQYKLENGEVTKL